MTSNLPATVTVDTLLQIGKERLHLNAQLPVEPIPLVDLYPLLVGIGEAVVSVGVKEAEQTGRKVSCRAGCGACCRQLVPIGPVEAHRLRAVANGLEAEHRQRVADRFRAAGELLAKAGLLETLLNPDLVADPEIRPLALRYFALGIPCPFLEAESCSIYRDRPMACREYLVTSPAENCAQPTPETIACVELPASPAKALRGLEANEGRPPWAPLIVALDWAAAHPPEDAAQSGPEWLRQFVDRLTTGD